MFDLVNAGSINEYLKLFDSRLLH